MYVEQGDRITQGCFSLVAGENKGIFVEVQLFNISLQQPLIINKKSTSHSSIESDKNLALLQNKIMLKYSPYKILILFLAETFEYQSFQISAEFYPL